MGERHSQYDLWRPNPVAESGLFEGKTFIVVNAPTILVSAAFDRIDPAVQVTYSEAGQPIASWTLTICRDYRGFPQERVENRPNY